MNYAQEGGRYLYIVLLVWGESAGNGEVHCPRGSAGVSLVNILQMVNMVQFETLPWVASRYGNQADCPLLRPKSGHGHPHALDCCLAPNYILLIVIVL
jgi:hypothetical protein|mmetsp:Transcript_73325/g.123490  ORF Transcript_73325/g.123490 Transcript_73325/m.123490 type:complete len:98 (-) Transcript_73325:410-703(-)